MGQKLQGYDGPNLLLGFDKAVDFAAFGQQAAGADLLLFGKGDAGCAEFR